MRGACHLGYDCRFCHVPHGQRRALRETKTSVVDARVYWPWLKEFFFFFFFNMCFLLFSGSVELFVRFRKPLR